MLTAVASGLLQGGGTMRLVRKEEVLGFPLVASPERGCVYGKTDLAKSPISVYYPDRERTRLGPATDSRLVGTDEEGRPVVVAPVDQERPSFPRAVGDNGELLGGFWSSTDVVGGVTIQKLGWDRLVLHWTERVERSWKERARVLRNDEAAWGPIALSPTGSRIVVAEHGDRCRLLLTRREEAPKDDAWLDLRKSDGTSLGASHLVGLCLLNDDEGLATLDASAYAKPPLPTTRAPGDMGVDTLDASQEWYALCHVSLKTGVVRKLGEWLGPPWIGVVDKKGTFAAASRGFLYFYRLVGRRG